MGIMREAAKLFSPSDPELVEKTLVRLAEQDTWNDVFSTKLIDLLDNIDRLKADLRQSSRKTEQRGAEAKNNFDQSAVHLKQAREIQVKASAMLNEARQHLLTSEEKLQSACQQSKATADVLAKAFEVASEARVRDIKSLSRLRIATVWATLAIACSWIGLVWVAWVELRNTMPTWAAYIATALIVLLAILIAKKRFNES